MNARRRSRRNRSKPNPAETTAPPAGSNSPTDASKKRKRRKPKPRTAEIAAFWGDASTLPDPPPNLRITADATAVVRSLGRPPLSGHETAAEHYLEPIYNRAVMLATALGAAGDLIEPEDLN